MSRFLLLALFCTSAIACTKAGSPHTTTLGQTPARVTQPAREVSMPAPVPNEINLRDKLAAARAQNLARLEAYAQNGAFPKNQVTPGLLNVFRDDEGHLCAVANLINIDGHANLVDTTARSDNFILLASVTSGPLLDWVLESGFTQEEIGMIQEPYEGEFQLENPIADEQELARFRAAEVVRVRTALLQVHRSISANTVASLDLAAQRANRGVAIARVEPQRFSQPPL